MQILLPTWLGSFYGCDWNLDDYELLVLQKVPESSRHHEIACFHTRWFDYRRLHPAQATFWFAECYRRIYKEYSKDYFGKSGIGCKNQIEQSREFMSFWNARQLCDHLGIEYSWFVRTLMSYRLSSGEWKNRLPRPQHLLGSSPDEREALVEAWQGYVKGDVMRTSTDPFYCVREWSGKPDQIEHENFVVSQIKAKFVKRYALADLVYKRQVLRFERVVSDFPDEINDMQKIASSFLHNTSETS